VVPNLAAVLPALLVAGVPRAGEGRAVIHLVLQDPDLTVGEEFAVTLALFRRRRALKREQLKRYQRSQALRGLCVNCPRKPEPGKKKCTRCLRTNYECNKAWVARVGRKKKAS
jgi:hypothetical protein